MRTVRLDNLEQFAAVNILSDPGSIPGPVVVPQCAQINLLWSLADGKVAHNVIYGRYAGTFAGSQAQANGILSALSSGAQWTALAAFLAPTTSLGGVTIRDVNTPNNAIIPNQGGGAPGTSSAAEMPDEVAAVITLRTAFVGPAFRGRMYIPGWASNAVGAGNIIVAGAVTALTNWGGTIAGALTAQGYTFVLGQKARAQYTSPATGRVHPARAATSTNITSATCKDNHWDTQRRRGLR